MKILPFILFSILFSLNGFSQEHFSPLARNIQKIKSLGAKFQTAAPFEMEQDTRSANKLSGILNGGQLLKLNLQSLQSLHKNKHETLLLEIPTGEHKVMTLELSRYELLTSDFKVTTSGSGNDPVDYQPGIYYRGIIQNQPNSLAAISIFENEIMGVASNSENGNMVLGKIKEAKTDAYIFYREKDLLVNMGFECGTDDPELTPDIIQRLKEAANAPSKSMPNCVRTYLECEYDMFMEQGSLESTVDFMTGLFNVVATIYQNESLTTNISEIFVWTEPDDYAVTSLFDAYLDFHIKNYFFNGDLALLVSRGAPTGGGIAPINGLCNYNEHAYTYITSSYEQLPTYSWSVHVIAHEMGHILGSYHTHACVWNGNNTAIDGCGPAAGSNEGCNADIPEAGTIMSYCQAVNGVGVDFNLGFGQQPGDVIRNNVMNAPCLTTCEAACTAAVSFQATEIDCFGGATGSIEAIIEGGVEPYIYLWSTGETSSSISGLLAGTYSLTVTDTEGCEASTSITLKQPDALYATPTVISPAFADSFDGVIDLAVAGGTAPYNCVWSNGSTAEVVAGLGEGLYSVTIFDSKGCEKIESFHLQANGCENTITAFPYFEGFENNLDFGTQNGNDDFDWTIHSGKTPTKHTGPKKAHEGKYYLYTEATGEIGHTAVITSPCIDLSGVIDPVLSFACHLFGNDMGTLEVDISEDSGTTWTNILSLSGSQSRKWITESLSLSAYANSVILIRFAGTVGGDRSDMAIDAIQVAGAGNSLLVGTSAVPAITHDLSIYPNPTIAELNISLKNEIAQMGTIRFLNIAGQVVKSDQVELTEGVNNFSIDVSNLGEGMYIIAFERKNEMPLTKKFAIIR